MQRALVFSALAGVSAVAVIAQAVPESSAQTGRPFRGAVSSAQPSGQQVNNTVASEAAYGERAGEGRNATPTPDETAAQGQSPEDGGAEDFGRPNPGRPGYQDPEFRGAAAGGQGGAQQGQQQPQQAQGQQQQQSQSGGGNDDDEDDPTVLTVNDGFFFDNYTSGSGFGVYGGEAVTSGQVQQLELPSAALVARNLGLPIGTGGNGAAPAQPQAPNDGSTE